jgi:hypothetical protein
MNCLRTTDPSGRIYLNACWGTTVSPSSFKIDVWWNSVHQTINVTTPLQMITCCDNQVAYIDYYANDVYNLVKLNRKPHISNGPTNAIVTATPSAYPTQDVDVILAPTFELPNISIYVPYLVVGGSFENALPTYDPNILVYDEEFTVNISGSNYGDWILPSYVVGASGQFINAPVVSGPYIVPDYDIIIEVLDLHPDNDFVIDISTSSNSSSSDSSSSDSSSSSNSSSSS